MNLLARISQMSQFSWVWIGNRTPKSLQVVKMGRLNQYTKKSESDGMANKMSQKLNGKV